MQLGALIPNKAVRGFLSVAIVVAVWVLSSFIAHRIYTVYGYTNSVAMAAYSLMIGSILLLPLTWRRVTLADLPKIWQVSTLGMIWFSGQVFYLFSLLYTSIGTNSAIQATSTAFSFIFSLVILRYAFRLYSAIGVLIVIGGVVLTSLFKAEVTMGDEFVIHETTLGIILAIVSAVFGGLFGTLFKKWVKVEENSGIVFGLFSIIAVVVGIPTIVICHYTGLQDFEIPSWKAALWFVGDALLCSVVGNFFFAQAYVNLTPVAVQVGLNMTIPISFFISAVILWTHVYPPGAIVGAVLIFMAVVLVSWDQYRYELLLKRKVDNVDEVDNKVTL